MKTNYSPPFKLLSLIFFVLICVPHSLLSQGSVTYGNSSTGTNESHTFTVPNGVRVIMVEAWGGGGGGAGDASSGNIGNGGGGGGAYARVNAFGVSPGDNYNASVGFAGAAGAADNGVGGAGGTSTFDTSTVVALGGAGGQVDPNGGAGGAGGSGAGSTGDVTYSGGNGAAGTGDTDSGGGGGGSGGSASAGNPGIGINGGAAVADGGAGGNGTENGAGNPGSVPGGGGGGGEFSGDNHPGGQGAGGQVRISWSCLVSLTSAVGTDDQELCSNNAITAITYFLSGEDISGATVAPLPAGVTSSFDSNTGIVTISGTPTETGIFNYVVTPTGGCTGTTASGTINVLTPPQITVQPATPGTVCETGGSTSITVTATGAGLTYQWRKNTVPLAEVPPYSDVTSATLIITNPPISENGASFDVVVSGSCPPSVTSDAVILTVDAAADGGTLTGGTTPFCEGSSTGNMTLNSYTGSIQKWQKQLDGGGWQDISHTNDTYSEVPSAAGTWDYRVVVESGVCTDVSTTVSITVDPATVAGSVSGGSTICLTENTGTLTLGGYTGSILRWQKRLDGGGWQDIVHTNDTYSEVPSAVGSWDYRAEVQSGVCAADFSAHTTVTVNANSVGGSVSGGNTPICHGESTGTMTLGGQVGSVTNWQRRLNAGSWDDIGHTSDTYSETPGAVGTWDYRAEVQNGSCTPEFSGFTSIVVLPRPTAVLSGSGSICLGQAVTLTLSVTAVGDWELNLDNGGGTFTGNGSGSFPAVVYPPTNTTYNITDMFDSQCTSEPGDLTGSATINVDEDCQVIYINAPDPLEAEISGTETICSGETVTITVTLSGGNQPWSIFVFPSTLYDNITGTEPFDFTFQVTPSSSITYDNTNIFVGDDEGCTPTVTGSAVITVYDEIEFDVTTNDISCFGAADGEITIEVTQGTGPFEYSIDNGDTYTAPTNTNPYTFSGLGPGDYDIRVKDANGCESPECP